MKLSKQASVCKQIKLKVCCELPTLNQVISVERRNRYAAAQLKKRTEQSIVSSLKTNAGLDGLVLEYPVDMIYQWHRKDRRTDPSNVAFAVKYLEDAMQTAGIIETAGPKQINSISHEYIYGAKNNWVGITLCSASKSGPSPEHQTALSGDT